MQRFDVIGANTVLGWRVVNRAADLGVPCVWLVQEPEFGLPVIKDGGRAAHAAFARADRVIFPSHATERLYGRFGDGGRFTTIHYGIDDVARSVPDQPPFERVDGHVHITHVGTLQRRKGADVLVEAVRRLSPDLRARLHTHFLGRPLFPDYFAELEERARGLENIDFVGEVGRSTGLGYMRHSDLFVCTSRDESGPIVVIEAMALARPVITTPVGLAGEVLRSGVDGEVVPSDDPDALALTLERVLQDADLRARLGAEARQTYERYLHSSRYAGDVVELFEQVLDRPR
jgi:glycosyltransferase involved in cell wall biosynthesis